MFRLSPFLPPLLRRSLFGKYSDIAVISILGAVSIWLLFAVYGGGLVLPRCQKETLLFAGRQI